MSRKIAVLMCSAVFLVGILLAQDARQEKKSVDLNGTWDMSLDTQNGTSTPLLKLKQQGENLTGEYTARMGTGQLRGTVKADQVDFQVSRDIEGSILVIRFVGQVVDPDKMMGEADLGDYGNGTWTAKRRKP